MINNKEELLDHLEKRLKESGALEFCKQCGIKNEKTCCSKISPFAPPGFKCPYLGKNGCTKRSVMCSLYFCTKLACKFPDLVEEFRQLGKKLKYTEIKFPVEV